MKNLRSIFFILMLLGIDISSCQKPIDFVHGSGPGNGSSGSTAKTGVSFIKAKINGTLLECSGTSGALAVIMQNTANGTVMQISGFKGNQGFTLLLNNYKGAGTFDLGNLDIGAYISDFTSLDGVYNSTSGKVVISYADDKTVRGTFTFVGENVPGQQKTITEGSFDIAISAKI
ncbi:MAG: DUF6252 family protein [Pedobacter sp.]|nr:DUF6252 family protein [Pedobacter sp.]MDQ8053409.1 DUF6252 family protein [Pedobacter sp.]